MNSPSPADTRREAAYSHCRAVLNKMERGECDYDEGAIFLIKILHFAESVEPIPS